jgi:endonuclease III-like uncharacterized protein
MKNTVQPPWSLPIGILADAEKELRLLKSVASSSEKEYDQIQKDIEAIEKELDSERFVSLLVVRSKSESWTYF